MSRSAFYSAEVTVEHHGRLFAAGEDLRAGVFVSPFIRMGWELLAFLLVFGLCLCLCCVSFPSPFWSES